MFVRLTSTGLAVVAALVLSLTFTSRDVHAQESADVETTNDAAEAHYQTAVRLFGEGRYREALDEFDAAIEISPESIFFCNRAIVLIKLKEQAQALRSLQRCRETFTGDDAERAQIDAQARGVAAFVHHIRPRATMITEDIAAGPIVSRTPEQDSGWDSSDVGYIALGGGAAMLASAGTLDWLSGDLREEFIRESAGGPGTSQQRYDEIKGELETRQLLFTGLVIGGGVFAATGATLLVYAAMSSSETAPNVTVGPQIREDGPGVLIRVDW